MTQPRFNPPPGWPPVPPGWRPAPDWKPDPSWPPPPDGWQLWVPGPPPTGTRSGQPQTLVIVGAAVGVVLILGVVGLGVAATTSGTNTDGAGTAPIATRPATAKPSGKPQPVKPAPTPVATKPADGPQIGRPVRDGKFEFTVTRVQTGVGRVGASGFGKAAQGQFVYLHMTVKNIGDEAQTFDGSSQHLYDTAGRKYDADVEAGIYLDQSQSFLNDINPGNTVSGIVIFDMPKGAIPARAELHDSPFSGGVQVRLR